MGAKDILLVNSGVVFNEEQHTYTLEDNKLIGITGLIGEKISGRKPTDYIPKAMKEGAERGSEIHKLCENLELDFLYQGTQYERIISNYKELLNSSNIELIDTEYNVTDRVFYATNIDAVALKEGKDIILIDIKTTKQKHLKEWSYQLSICKHLFELQNEELAVSGLYIAYIPNDETAELIEVEDKGADLVQKILLSGIEGTEFNEVEITEEGEIEHLIEELKEVRRRKAAAESREKEILSILEPQLLNMEVEQYKGEGVVISYIKPSISERFDSKRFREDNEELYKQYVTPTERKGYFKYKVTSEE